MKNVSLVIFVALLSALIGTFWFYTGQFSPPSGDAAIWFYTGLLGLLIAKFVVEYRFTKPNDVLVNCLAVFVSTSTLSDPPNAQWWEMLRWLTVFCAIGSLILAWDLKGETKTDRSATRTFFYRLLTRLGSANVLFSATFLLGLLSYAELDERSSKAFVIIWGFTLIISFLDIGSLVQAITVALRNRKIEPVGEPRTFLEPAIVYCTRLGDSTLRPYDLVRFAAGKNDPVHFGMVLDERSTASQRVATVALLGCSVREAELSQRYRMFASNSDEASHWLTDDRLAFGDPSKIVGTVRPGSHIQQIRFEIFADRGISSGSLLALKQADSVVYFQVFDGIIAEEATLDGNDRGYIEGRAEQVGWWSQNCGGFEAHNWVVNERSFVSLVDEDQASPEYELDAGEITIGSIPQSNYPVNISLSDMVLFHTGILGVTGSGKSFLTFDLVDKCAAEGIKVVCVDPTGDYQRYLLDAVLLEGPGSLDAFLNSADHRVAICEVSNSNVHPITQANNLAQRCLNWCKDNRTEDDILNPKAKVLVVLEEAHLLIPEFSFNSEQGMRNTVNKTSQIVLQARKYGLGFLIVSQRTANVVKSVLNQCNTIVSFQAFDETGFDFLKNYMGSYHVASLPTLSSRHGILVGKASASRQPLMVRFNEQNRALRQEPAQPMPLPDQPDGEAGG